MGFIWVLMVYFLPGPSNINKFWKILLLPGAIQETVQDAKERTADALAPKVDKPLVKGQMIGQCITVTSPKMAARDIVVKGKRQVRPHDGWDLANLHSCYAKVNDVTSLRKVYAVGDPGDVVNVTCLAPKETGGYGYMAIAVNKAKDFGLEYSHLQKGTCTPREITIGATPDLIGKYGNTGNSEGAHLHVRPYQLSTGKTWDEMPTYMAYQIFRVSYDPLVQKKDDGEKEE